MSSGVGAAVTFGAYVMDALMISGGGGVTRNRLQKPLLGDLHVTQEAEGQDLWEPISLRVDLDAMVALPPTADSAPDTLTITYPLPLGSAGAPATMVGQAQVLDYQLPEMEAGSVNEVTINFLWNTVPVFTPVA